MVYISMARPDRYPSRRDSESYSARMLTVAGALLSVSGSCTRFACFSAASQLVAPGADADRGPSKAGYFFAPLKALVGSELPVLSGCDRAICNLSHASLVSVFVSCFFQVLLVASYCERDSSGHYESKRSFCSYP